MRPSRILHPISAANSPSVIIFSAIQNLGIVTGSVLSRSLPVRMNFRGNWLVPATGTNRHFISPSTISMTSARFVFAKTLPTVIATATVIIILFMFIVRYLICETRLYGLQTEWDKAGRQSLDV
jgi:hypothetical protein